MNRVLVSLDGSEFAEQALPFAEALAARGGSLVLLQVALALSGGRRAMHTEQERSVRAADRYLQRLERYYTGKGVETERLVRYGPAAERLVEAAQEIGADLIVMASHGRSGLSRWALGSVTDRVVRTAPCPVLVVRSVAPPLWTGEPPRLSRVVVPLDGSDLAETALTVLDSWYGRLIREVTLVRVIGQDAAGFDGAEIRARIEEAQTYVMGVALRLDEGGFVVETEVRAGEPGEEIVASAAEHEADAIMLSSHGRSGLSRWLLGSVVQRVLEGTPLPVLIVRQSPAKVEEDGAGAVPTAHCLNCGRAYYGDLASLEPDARCLRCGFHLHSCGNCVYFDGIECLLQRPEATATIPGQRCTQFTFRQGAASATADAPA